MRSYVIVLNWTDQGAKDAAIRFSAPRVFCAAIEGLGGEVSDHLYTLGEYDMVIVTGFPDDDIAAAAMLQLGSLGNVRTKTMRAFTDEEAAAAITRLG